MKNNFDLKDLPEDLSKKTNTDNAENVKLEKITLANIIKDIRKQAGVLAMMTALPLAAYCSHKSHEEAYLEDFRQTNSTIFLDLYLRGNTSQNDLQDENIETLMNEADSLDATYEKAKKAIIEGKITKADFAKYLNYRVNENPILLESIVEKGELTVFAEYFSNKTLNNLFQRYYFLDRLDELFPAHALLSNKNLANKILVRNLSEDKN